MIRLVDARFAEKRIEVKSPLKFDLKKPEALYRMSNIAFAATSFLSGDTSCRLAVVSMEEDEEESDAQSYTLPR